MNQGNPSAFQVQIDPKLPLLAVLIVGMVMACGLSRVVDVSAGEAQKTTNPVPTEGVKPDFAAPYDHYTLTQGPHGFSYGHHAIDLSAGKGTKIKSPIQGSITEYYVDGLGNTTLVIENKQYRVTMLHGDYSVSTGESVRLGQTIGRESNHGNTTDLLGRSCAGRDCGYHTHLNVFDKVQNMNINPLSLIDP